MPGLSTLYGPVSGCGMPQEGGMTLGEIALFSQLRAVQGTKSSSPEGGSGWLIIASTAAATSRGYWEHAKAHCKGLNKCEVLVAININSNISGAQ